MLLILIQEGVPILTKLYNELKERLSEWEAILATSRRQHYLLSFINASQLLLLRSYLDNTLSEEMKPHVRSALVFIHPSGASLPLDKPEPIKDAVNANDLFARVCGVGSFLDTVSLFPLFALLFYSLICHRYLLMCSHTPGPLEIPWKSHLLLLFYLVSCT